MSVNYDLIAPQFDERYLHRPLPQIESRIRGLVSCPGITRVLEVGCGTGHWLSILDRAPIHLVGADPSLGMLHKASALRSRASLVCARAEALPFPPEWFDLIFCVNAFHHFSDPEKFLRDSKLLLGTRGRIAIFGLDPHARGTQWYQYEYLPGLREKDLARYTPHEKVKKLLLRAGFQQVETDLVEHIHKTFAGEAVFGDPFLERFSSSQLLIISEEDYRAGRRAIASAIQAAEAHGRGILFEVNLMLFATVGYAHESA